MRNSNIFDQEFKISTQDKRCLNKHNSFLLFFTGLSGSGKSTIANALEQKLHNNDIRTSSLDGDNIRKGISSDLLFSDEDRKENIRRIAHVSKLFIDSGIVVLASFIAPFEKDRKAVKEIVGSENFLEVFVDTSIEECERRDIKGLYKKARKGEISNFTGISSPYEKPESPDIKIETIDSSVEEAVELIYSKIKSKLSIDK